MIGRTYPTQDIKARFEITSLSGQHCTYLRRAAEAAGVTRMAEISQLVSHSFPVIQTCRPMLWGHSSIGQNTGSQGKSPEKNNAIISALMEAIETYSTEPRCEFFIRGSYRYLAKHHRIAPPQIFLAQNRITPKESEPLLWTSACHWDSGEEVLVPAEAVFFPLFPTDYETRSVFVAGSSGVGAGFSYRQASEQALFELIERHIVGLWEKGKLIPYAFTLKALQQFPKIKKILRQLDESDEFEVMAFFPKKKNNLPCLAVILKRHKKLFYGSACHLDPEKAILSACAEALQSCTTFVSGSREDLESATALDKAKLPIYRTLEKSIFLRRVLSPQHKKKEDRFACGIEWLRQNGFANVFLVNLTRKGIDIPVVRCLVPGLTALSDYNSGIFLPSSVIRARKFGYATLKK